MRKRRRNLPLGGLLAMLGLEGLKAGEVGLGSKSNDEIIMSYFTCPDCSDTSLMLTDVDAILVENGPDTVGEFLHIAAALERSRRVAEKATWVSGF